MQAMSVPAYFLPGGDDPTLVYTTVAFGTGPETVCLSMPHLTPERLSTLSTHLRLAQEANLAPRPIADIVAVIDRVAQLWLDPEYPYRQQAETLLPIITGYTVPMVRHGLETLLQQFCQPALWRLLHAELGDPLVLDTFRPRPHVAGLTRAYGPRLVSHIFSGNVPALPAWSLICALLTKSASLGKSASEEPLFAALFARSLWEVCPEIGACIAVGWWQGGDTTLEAAAFAQADAVIAYGSDATIRDIQRRVPLAARFLAYGHKLSFGVIGREVLTTEGATRIASQAAYGVSVFDQQGCVSPHVLYVERGGAVSPREFATLLAHSMARVHETMPRGVLSLAESTAIRHLRGAYEFRQLADDSVLLLCSEPGTAWTVIYEETTSFTPSCLNRTVRVLPVDDIQEIAAQLEPIQAYLQTVGVALAPARQQTFAEVLGRLGVSRLCRLERMPWPQLTWHHDGRCVLLDLLRWTDFEGDPNDAIPAL